MSSLHHNRPSTSNTFVKICPVSCSRKDRCTNNCSNTSRYHSQMEVLNLSLHSVQTTRLLSVCSNDRFHLTIQRPLPKGNRSKVIAAVGNLLVPWCRTLARPSILGRRCAGSRLRIGGSAFVKASSLTRVIIAESLNHPSSTTEENSSDKSFSLRYRTHPFAAPTLICSANSIQKGWKKPTDDDVKHLRCCFLQKSHFL